MGQKNTLASGKPSKTAEFMALFRALEYAYPKERRLFEDPFAIHFLSPFIKSLAYASRLPLFRGLIVSIMDRNWPGARASGIARTRLIDDLLLQALKNGVQQIVILGAGFDSRAYRIPEIENYPVFEVDHPSTLNVKKRKMKHIVGDHSNAVRYVKTNFINESLEESLSKAGFIKEKRTLILWEGVTNYLTESAVRQTLRFISRLAEETLLVFTYVHENVITMPNLHLNQRLYTTLKRQGEPWTFGISPSHLSTFLQSCGLQLLEDMDSVDYRKRYMHQSGMHMKGYEFYRICWAKVPRQTTEGRRDDAEGNRGASGIQTGTDS